MSSLVTRGEKAVRPSWNHVNIERLNPSIELHQLEMLESIRNAIETLGQSQMMQCDVAGAIKSMNRAISRIDRRLAKLEDMKLGKGRR